MMATLEAARDALLLCPSIVAAQAGTPATGSCKIGLEANISPSDYPLIRLVPARINPGAPYQNRTGEVLIYFGAPTANSAGLEQVYADLFTLEAEILQVVRTLGGRWRETLTDEDRLDAYKLMAARVELIDAIPAPP
jgi:hypothetical protein